MNTYSMIREIKQWLVRYKHKYDRFTNQRLSYHSIETEAYDKPEWYIEEAPLIQGCIVASDTIRFFAIACFIA